MRTFKRKRGFLTIAQNGKDDYLRMAYAMALSLRATQYEVPHLSVMITPGMDVPDKYREVFDEVIDIPWIDEAQNSQWKLENEWKVYHVTPYEETVKLDADMLFTTDIKEWWPLIGDYDIFPCMNVETYRGDLITSDFYRKCFTANNLPNVYTGFMYFKYNDFVKEFFDHAEMIYHNWQRYFGEFLEPNTRPPFVSTDVVFALALKFMDYPLPIRSVPRFVHMKSQLQGWPEMVASDDNWLRHVPISFTDDLVLKVGRYRQYLPFHYQNKDFLTDEIIQAYERH